MQQSTLSQDLKEAYSKKQILVTGGAGFIGSHLVDALAHLNAKVRVIDNLMTGKLENLNNCIANIEFVKADIRDYKECEAICSGVDLVFHQAALGSVPRSLEFPELTMGVNVMGTTNIFTAAMRCKVKKVIFASSSSLYGDSKKLPKKEGEEGQPLSPYALSKQVNEATARNFSRCYGLDLVGLRYFNVYGPRQDPDGPYAAVIPRFFKACYNNDQPVIYGDGEQTRDFSFVSDVVSANLLAALPSESKGFNVFNISGGKRIAINELASIIINLTKTDIKPCYEKSRPGDVMHSEADLSAAKNQLMYVPKTDIKSGLEMSLESYTQSFLKSE